MFENITAAPADPILGPPICFVPMNVPAKLTSGLVSIKMRRAKPGTDQREKAEQYLLENETTKITSALTASLNLVAALRNCCLVKVAP